MKMLFHKDLCDREFGSAVFNVPALLKWATDKGLHLHTAPPLDEYDFAQAEALFNAIQATARAYTPDEAYAIAQASPLLAHHRAAQRAAPSTVWLIGAEASRQWREILSKAIAGGELVLLDPNSLLPVVTANAPAAKRKAVPVTTPAPVATTHKIQTRTNPLDAEIKIAKEQALDKTSVQSVWDALVKMADSKQGCLLGHGNIDEIKYGSCADTKIFTKKLLGDRMRRA